MENVRTGSWASCDIRPTMIVESIPPDRNAPSGTSLCKRISTAEVEQLPQLPGVLFGGPVLLDVEIGLPVRPHFQPVLPIHGVVARRQLGDAPEDRPRMRHVLVGQVIVQGLRVDLPRHAGHFQHALQLAGEQQPARLVPIDQRLLAQPVAGQEQLPPPGVPEGEGEHAVQVREHLRPLVLVEMDEHFRVALGAEAVAGPLQPAAELAEVVDFAVEDDPHRAVLVGHRLLAAGEVDDRQPAMAQGDSGQWAVAVASRAVG